MLAVAVGVEPHAVAQFGGAVEAGVDARIVLAGGEDDSAGLAGGVDVAVERVVALVRGGDEVAGRRHDGDRVGARGDGEAVVAGSVGGGGGHRGAVLVLQLHGDASNAGFTGVLHAVGVGVFPDAIAEGGRALVNEVVAGARLALGEGHADLVGVAAVGVAHVGVARLVGLFDGVAAGRHVVEDVVAVGVGGGGGDRVALGVLQHDGGAFDRGVARAVVVQVFTDGAADDAGLALVDEHVAAVGFTRGDRHADHVGVAAVGVAHVQVARRGLFDDGVVAGRHVREAVVAVRVGGGGGHRVAVRVLQHDGDARQRGVAHVVVVGVFEHAPGDRARVGDDAGVPGPVGLAGVEDGLGGLAIGHVGVGVARVATRVGGGEAVARRQGGLVELDAVGAGAQVGKQILAVSVGGEGAIHEVAGGVVEAHEHAGDAGFAAVLLAVAVGVEPHAVAELGAAEQAGVDGGVGFTGHDGHRGAVAEVVDVAVGGVAGAHVGLADAVAGGRCHRHGVGARIDGEAVVAAAVGGGGGHRVAVGVLQLHGDTGNAGFTCVLHAIGVGVFPHAVADDGLGREGDIEREGVGGEVEVVAAAAIRAAVVTHLEVEGDRAAAVDRGGVDQLAGGDVGSLDLLAGANCHAVKGQRAAGRHAGHHDRLEVVAFHRIGEAEVGRAEHEAATADQGHFIVGAGGRVVHRGDIDLQIEDEGVAGAVGAEHPNLLDPVEVRQLGHVHREGVLVHRGEEAGGDFDVLVGRRVEDIELDAGRIDCGVVRISLLEQIGQLVVDAGVFAKGDAG